MTRIGRLVRKVLLWAVQGQLSDAAQVALTNMFARTLPTDTPATLVQMQANKGWVFAVNRQIGGRGSRVQPRLNLVTRRLGKGPEKTVVHDHPLLDLLAQPNAIESGTVFHWRQLLQLNTIGRTYVRVTPEWVSLKPLGVDLMAARIGTLDLLDPYSVKPIMPDIRRRLAFDYQPPEGGREVLLGPPSNRGEREQWRQQPYPFVFRTLMPSAESPHGQSPVQAADWAIAISEALGKLLNTQLTKGIHADMIFYLLKEFDDPERFRKAVVILMQGINKAGEPMVVPKKTVEVAPTPRGNKDMAYPELSESARQEQIAVLGGSDGIVGLGGDLNRATVEGMERIFALGTVDPLNELIADMYNSWLLPLYAGQGDGAWYEIDYPSAAAVDELTQADWLTKLTGGKPVYTANEAREELGKEARSDGDSLTPTPPTSQTALLGGTQGQVQLPGTPPTKALPPPPCENCDEARRRLLAGRPFADYADFADCVAKNQDKSDPEAYCGAIQASVEGKALPMPTAAGEKKSVPAAHPLSTPEARKIKWTELTQTQRVSELSFRKKVAKVFKEWREQVVGFLKDNGPAVLMTRDADPFHQDDWAMQFRTMYGEHMGTVVAVEVARIAESLGIDVQSASLDASIVQAAERRAEFFANQVTETQIKLIQRTLAMAAQDELSMEDTLSEVGATFPKQSSERIHGMATTEIGTMLGVGLYLAASHAQQAAADAAPNLGLMWLSQGDDFVRPSHGAVDGDVVTVGEAFQVGGCLMRFPMDGDLCGDAAEIIGCRCRSELIDLRTGGSP